MVLLQPGFRRMLSSQVKRAAVRPELQLMAGYLEHLDSMMESTKNIEQSMQKLNETYAQKKTAIQRPTIQWTDTTEIDRLFDQSQQHKDDITAEIVKMKQLMTEARKIFAVEAPDGISDAMMQEDMKQVSNIIEEAALKEDTAEIKAQQKVFAVDAPDGDTDGNIREEMKEVSHMIEEAALEEDPAEIKAQQKVFAVDAPDGDTDGRIQEEMKEVRALIDDAAEKESPEAIEMKHRIEEAIKLKHARDPEHDW